MIRFSHEISVLPRYPEGGFLVPFWGATSLEAATPTFLSSPPYDAAPIAPET
jgi:hypothetical protein